MANGPGKYYRNTIPIIKLLKMFPDSETAETFFINTRWKNGIHCPHCGSTNTKERANRKPRSWRCRERECRKDFSVKTNTLMHNSKMDFQKWAIAIYLHLTDLTGVSSMKLHRDLDIQQHHAWHMLHRIRNARDNKMDPFVGTSEADETFVGGKKRNMRKDKRDLIPGRGGVGKSIVIGIKNRDTNRIQAQVIPNTKKPTIHKFIEETVADGSSVYSDELKSYLNMRNIEHKKVHHKSGEYVRYEDLEKIHTNGVESFWSHFKAGFRGTYRQMSVKHLDRYVKEFVGRHNDRELDTLAQMESLVRDMDGKTLPYAELVAEAA